MQIISFMVLICLGSISAQTFIGKINPVPDVTPVIINSSDSLKILAVMVDFPEDKDEATLGNGKFGTLLSKDYGKKILDPLPHDLNYFRKHLTFAQNYFEKVSKGKLNISFDVLGDIFTASKTMRNYSPISTSDDLTPLGNLSKEIWEQVQTKYPDLHFYDYDIFLIFHAGAGRDVSLPGSFGNEKDIPSVYLSDKALKQIFNDNLTGLPQNRYGKYNTMVIPETESREVSSLGGNVLVELTINGLIVSSIASHLGLPDLFDTNTGLSAIGRFGLMDGQAIFAYSGCFPPEPSAWEKIYLGWATPVEASLKDMQINITTNLAATASDTVVFKIPINANEYYLVENRIRDANKDGSKVTISMSDNQVLNLTFPKDTDGYYSYEIDSLSGEVLDVDEFDWALPGNGIVIWHIDENIINSKINDNTINTDKNQRGIDVEEADGIQDIGEEFTTIFGDQVVGEGDAVDFWYGTNPSKLFKNKFTKDSRPNTLSNSGANSLISLTDFSPISNKMSFKLSWGDSLIRPITVKDLKDTSDWIYLNSFTYNDSLNFIVTTPEELKILDVNGKITFSHKFNNFFVLSPAVKKINNSIYYYSCGQNKLNYFIKEENSSNIGTIVFPDFISSKPVIWKKTDGSVRLIIGTQTGKVYFLSLGSGTNEAPSIIDSIALPTFYVLNQIAVSDSYYSMLCNDSREIEPGTCLLIDSENNSLELPYNGFDLNLTKDKTGNFVSIVSTRENKIYKIINNKIVTNIKLNSTVLTSLSLGDVNQTGENNIVFIDNGNLDVRNMAGASIDNFPGVLANGKSYFSKPIVADFYGNKSAEIISTDENGNVYALDGSTGKLVDGFPIPSGKGKASNLLLGKHNNDLYLSLIASGKLYVWNIGPSTGELYWSSLYGDQANTSFVQAASSTNKINSFFPTERAYNYPNPVYGDETNIRYFVSEDSKINIRIFDLAGDFVAELNDNATGGFDNETIWDVKNVQSGVYLARVEAVGASGKTENTVIKIAVIK